jgi:single-stranded-DNA-specific exonuclease
LGIDLATTLADAGPWGQGFPAPLFDGDFELAEQRVVSGQHLKLLLRPQGGGQCVDGMLFNATERGWPQELRHARLAYRLTVNEYQGSRGPQLVVEHAIAPR